MIQKTIYAVCAAGVALSLGTSAFACGEDKEGKGSSDESVVRELCGEDKDGKSSGDESVVSRLCGEDKDHEPSDDES